MPPYALIDGHCHLDLPAYDATRSAVIDAARTAGVTGFILAGVDPPGWVRQRALSQAHARMWWTAGIHPWAAAHVDPAGVSALLDAAFKTSPAPVAVGEIGLDGVGQRRLSLDHQAAVFRAQLGWARVKNYPVVLHLVRAHGRALEILRRDGIPTAGGVVHRFTGPSGRADAYLRLGLHLGFADAGAAAARVPLDRLILESDADDPRGRSPAGILQIANEIAELRGCDVVDVIGASQLNVRRLYALG
ncbi:MAG: TatD DNase family protein [Bradymonadia bacterium]|jgi:TatD DNase family protein